MKIAITGTTGFVGRAILQTLITDRPESEAVSIARSEPQVEGFFSSQIQTDFYDNQQWIQSLEGVDVLIHCAARAHVMSDDSTDPCAEYMKFNRDATLCMATAAVAAGVRRLVFLSTIKVNGEFTEDNRPFTSEDTPNPLDYYGRSKHEAEVALQKLSEETGLEVIIIRPPLVYGPAAKGNLETVVKLVRKNLPLPFGSIDNLRSLISLENLVSVVIHCVDNVNVTNEIFLVSDDDDISTTELIRGLSLASGHKPLLFPVPRFLLTWLLKLIGKEEMASRLFNNLQLDISKTKSTLGWVPPRSVQDGFNKCFIKE